MSKLDLKYRPKNFSEVLGNAGVKKLLIARSNNGTISDQSMMFGGPKGCGKTTLARIVSRAILCTDICNGEPCGECNSCISILNEVNPSVEELDAASQGTVDKIRDMVRDIDYGTIDGNDNRIYTIDEAQRLSKAAQEALLKSIEGRFFTVILCTTEPQNIKGPIRDRLEEYPISPPSASALVDHLITICSRESIEYEEAALDIIISMNSRTPRSCILTIGTLSELGPITVAGVKKYYRYDSYSSINEILSFLDPDPSKAFSLLSDLFYRENPVWVRDSIVLAISSGLRKSVGSVSRYPVPIHFFPNRGKRWLSLAKHLGNIDRPTQADIEASLLIDSPTYEPTVNIITQVSSKMEPEPEEKPEEESESESEPEPEPTNPTENHLDNTGSEESKLNDVPESDLKINKEVEVDGIRFNSNEELTTLDHKVINSKPEKEDNESVSVTLDDSRAPIPEKEFARQFVKRIRNSSGS